MTNQEHAAEVAATAKHRIDAKLGHIWWAILLRGLLAVALAICAFVWPEQTLNLFIKLLGAYFLIDGIIGAIGAYRSSDKAAPLIQSIVSLAMGIALLVWTGVSAKIFLVLVGIWLALQGLGLLISAFRMDAADSTRGLMMGIGGIVTLIGVVFVFWTDTGLVSISWLIGLGSLVIGALLIFLATRVRKLQMRVASAGKPA